jgi:hypothetical protein
MLPFRHLDNSSIDKHLAMNFVKRNCCWIVPAVEPTVPLAAAWRSGPLNTPGSRLLTIGRFTSTIGDYCYAVARPWLVLSGTRQSQELGWMGLTAPPPIAHPRGSRISLIVSKKGAKMSGIISS